MKKIIKNSIILKVILSAALLITSCSEDEVESDATKVTPLVTAIDGAAVGNEGSSSIYTVSPYRGGSEYIWTVENATMSTVDGRADQIEVSFNQIAEPVSISVFETAFNGQSSDAISTEVTVFGIPCTWSIIMNDSYGDGWNGAGVTITYEGVALGTYTLDSGASITQEIGIPNGGDFTATFISGDWDSEVSYQIYDPSGALVFEDGPEPLIGDAYSATNLCDSF